MKHTIWVVIPCYNEVNRLPVEMILDYSPHFHFVLVDDGSSDGTKEKLLSLESSKIHPLILKKNSGKAEAVRQGFLYALKQIENEEQSWIGFLDADLATPLNEIFLMMQYKDAFYPTARSVWASRWFRLGSQIDRKLSRHYSGRVFATLAYLFTKIPTYDSQCGAKLFQKEYIKNIFERPFITRWLFDIEIYFRLKDEWGETKIAQEIVEYPLKNWTDVDGSKINLTEMIFKVLPQLYKIRKYYKIK